MPEWSLRKGPASRDCPGRLESAEYETMLYGRRELLGSRRNAGKVTATAVPSVTPDFLAEHVKSNSHW